MSDSMSFDKALAELKPYGYEYGSVRRSEIELFIRSEGWQQLRLVLKGKSTDVKIHELGRWYWRLPDRERHVQVTNYLNALKRGGQLK